MALPLTTIARLKKLYRDFKGLAHGSGEYDQYSKLLNEIFSQLQDLFQADTAEDSPGLNLIAIASSDNPAEKSEEYKSQREFVFKLITACLIPPLKSSSEKQWSFDVARAKNYYKTHRGTLVSGNLKEVQNKNAGIIENFLNGNFNKLIARGRLEQAHHWLTEVDLKRTINLLHLPEKIVISAFDATTIRSELHFARLAHERTAEDPTQPYKIRLLLAMGADASGGTHWIRATVTVTPPKAKAKGKVEITLTDSLMISEDDQRAREIVLQEAIKLDELSEVAGIAQVYSAFPEYELTCNHSLSPIQRDNWSCGLHALVNSIQEMQQEKNIITTQSPELLKSLLATNLQQNLAGESMARDVMRAHLESITLTQKQIATSKLPAAVFEKITAADETSGYRVSPQYINYCFSAKPSAIFSSSTLPDRTSVSELISDNVKFVEYHNLFSKQLASLYEFDKPYSELCAEISAVQLTYGELIDIDIDIGNCDQHSIRTLDRHDREIYIQVFSISPQYIYQLYSDPERLAKIKMEQHKKLKVFNERLLKLAKQPQAAIAGIAFKISTLSEKTKKITINLNELFDSKDDKTSCKIKLQALISMVNQHPEITAVNLLSKEKIPLELEQLWMQAKNIVNFEINSKAVSNRDSPLIAYSKRNLLYTGIDLQNNQDCMDTYWLNQITATKKGVGPYILFRTHRIDNHAIIQSIDYQSTQYLQSLFDHLIKYQQLYSTNKVAFPYTKLEVGLSYKPANLMDTYASDPDGDLSLGYLQVLIDNFNNPGTYFPFKDLVVGINSTFYSANKDSPGFSTKLVSSVKQLLLSIKQNQPTVDTLSLELYQPNHMEKISRTTRNIRYFSLAELDEIIEFCRQNKITTIFIFEIPSEPEETKIQYLERRTALQNMTLQFKHQNIQHKPVAQVTATSSSFLSSNIDLASRPVKNAQFNLEAGLGIEQSYDMEHQHQVEHLQEIEVPAKPNQVVFSIGVNRNDTSNLMNKAEKINNQLSTGTISDVTDLYSRTFNFRIPFMDEALQRIYNQSAPAELFAWYHGPAAEGLPENAYRELPIDKPAKLTEVLSAFVWDVVFGPISAAAIVPSERAFNVIKRNIKHFVGGLNPDDLPQGFEITRGTDGRLQLYYNDVPSTTNTHSTPLTITLEDQADSYYAGFYGDIRSLSATLSRPQFREAIKNAEPKWSEQRPAAKDIKDNELYFYPEEVELSTKEGFRKTQMIKYIGKLNGQKVKGVVDNRDKIFGYKRNPGDFRNEGMSVEQDVQNYIKTKKFDDVTNFLESRLANAHEEYLNYHSVCESAKSSVIPGDKQFNTLGLSITDMLDAIYEFLTAGQDNADALNLSDHEWCINFKTNSMPVDSPFRDFPTLRGLFDLLYHDGYPGVNQFLSKLKELKDADENLYASFTKHFLKNNRKLRFLANGETYNILNELAGLSEQQKNWWMGLLDQHKGPNPDFIQMYNGFKYFVKNVPFDKLPQHQPFSNRQNYLVDEGVLNRQAEPAQLDHKLSRRTYKAAPVVANKDDYIGGHMLMSLSRLQYILSQVKPEQIAHQGLHLNGLNYGMQGAWHAARWNNFHFFHQAMQLRPDKYDAKFEEGVLKRKKFSYQVGLEHLQQIITAEPTIVTNNFDYIVILYHRFLGGFADLHVDYNFYIALANEIKSLYIRPNNLKVCVLTLMALVTSGPRGSKIPKNYEMIKKDIYRMVTTNNLASKILNSLINDFENFAVKPNLGDMHALLNLLDENLRNSTSFEADYRQLMAKLAPFDMMTWAALETWNSNPNKMPAQNFLGLNEQLKQDYSSDGIKILKIITGLKLSTKNDKNEAELKTLINTFKTLRDQKPWLFDHVLNHLHALKVNLDTAHTQPSVADINGLLSSLCQLQDDKTWRELTNKTLIDCELDFEQWSDSKLVDSEAVLHTGIRAINKLLRDNYKTDENFDKLSVDQIDNFATLIPQHLSKVNNIEIAPDLLSQLKKVLVDDYLRAKTAKIPSLLNEFMTKFPFPVLQAGKDHFTSDIASVVKYYRTSEKIINIFINWKYQWKKLSPAEFFRILPDHCEIGLMADLLNSVNKLKLNFYPKDLLEFIFNSATLNSEYLQSVNAILTSKLSYSEKTQTIGLIKLFNANEAQTLQLIQQLSAISDDSLRIKTMDFYQQLGTKNRLTGEFLTNKITELNVILSSLSASSAPVKALEQQVLKLLVDNPPVTIKLANLISSMADNKEILLTMLVTSCSKEKLDTINSVIDALAKSDKEIILKLNELYQHPPYPTSEILLNLLSSAGPKDLTEKIRNYEIDPKGKRSSPAVVAEQFALTDIAEKIDQIEDLTRSDKNKPGSFLQLPHYIRKTVLKYFIFTNMVGHSYPLTVPWLADDKRLQFQKPASALTNQQLIELLQSYIVAAKIPTPLPKHAMLEYMALVREAIYRVTGKLPYPIQMVSMILGSIYNKSVLYEIKTGEGKGITNCLLNSLQVLQAGFTLRSTTSNLTLSTRDAEEFSDFYKMLNVETQVVTSQSSNYQDQVYNYSTMPESSLLRSKEELLQGKERSFLMTIDEIDFDTDDRTDAILSDSLDPSADPNINPEAELYEWIYKFVTTPKLFSSVKCGRVQDVENLQRYLKQNMPAHLQPKFYAYIHDMIHYQTLDRWLDSASIASRLIENKNFTIDNEVVLVNQIPKNVKVARVMRDERVVRGASFSNGVHPFLHVRLNMANKDKNVHFHIKPEKIRLTSRTPKNEIAYVLKKGGRVFGNTGTLVGSGSEVTRLQEIFNNQVVIVRIPPHKTRVHIRHDTIVAKLDSSGAVRDKNNKDAHHREIMKMILICLTKQPPQPVLVFCAGVTESEELAKYIKANVEPDKHHLLQLFTSISKQDTISEAEVIKTAGGMITTTTSVMGRGTHINTTHPEGLLVIDTTILPTKEALQHEGRTSRQGQKGQSVLILNQDEINLYRKKYPQLNSIKDLSAWVKAVQQQLDNEISQTLRIKDKLGDIREEYFQKLLSFCREKKLTVGKESWASLHPLLLKMWSEYTIYLDDKINKFKQKLITEELLPNSAGEMQEFTNFQEQVDKNWQILFQRMTNFVEPYVKHEVVDSASEPATNKPVIHQLAIEKAVLSSDIYDPLHLAEINPEQVYLDLTGIKNAEISDKIALADLSYIVSHMKKFKMLAQDYHQPKVISILPLIMEHLLKVLLDKISSKLSNTAAETISKASLLDLYNKLMKVIKSSNNATMQKSAVAIHREYLNKNLDNPVVAKQLLNMIRDITGTAVVTHDPAKLKAAKNPQLESSLTFYKSWSASFWYKNSIKIVNDFHARLISDNCEYPALIADIDKAIITALGAEPVEQELQQTLLHLRQDAVMRQLLSKPGDVDSLHKPNYELCKDIISALKSKCGMAQYKGSVAVEGVLKYLTTISDKSISVELAEIHMHLEEYHLNWPKNCTPAEHSFHNLLDVTVKQMGTCLTTQLFSAKDQDGQSIRSS